ncbi:hypothetical protein JHK82_034060 [Glycine max]|nr:hypothetical protein JHK87_033989 [Glycine soja]KAG4980810.1 hypothetical protein JHK85_034768 [Glycine max]KAG4986439.1 hypothetical protein JHK86_034130 [Glycine max]KAG5119640.1 hypothetical protein JHK82_034060 [Glycine max]KAG5140626.1 hypothetical protein JHK84_034394 [Glycine max]
MKLSIDKAHVCAYIFNPKLDKRYIPIYDDTSHWYLMVICIDENKFYHLNSNMTLESLEDKRQAIRTMRQFMFMGA